MTSHSPCSIKESIECQTSSLVKSSFSPPCSKSTSFMTAGGLDLSFFDDNRCLGVARGQCKFRFGGHRELKGIDPITKQFWTKIAEPYPVKLCKAAALASA